MSNRKRRKNRKNGNKKRSKKNIENGDATWSYFPNLVCMSVHLTGCLFKLCNQNYLLLLFLFLISCNPFFLEGLERKVSHTVSTGFLEQCYLQSLCNVSSVSILLAWRNRQKGNVLSVFQLASKRLVSLIEEVRYTAQWIYVL